MNKVGENTGLCRAYVVSLNFNPGHVSHMVASYRQLEELSYESWMYIDKQFVDFIPKGLRYVIYGEDKPFYSDVAIFLFPSYHNLREIVWMKRKCKSKIVYIFHEPLDKLSSYRKAGFSHMKMLKLRMINLISALTVRWSDVILLPSEKAVGYYEANRLYHNKNYYYLPLMYDDETNGGEDAIRREYFSYIGTVASDHSFNEYLQFVCWAIDNKVLTSLRFLIATKSRVEMTDLMKRLMDSGRLELIEGRPLTNMEINRCYASSILVWNAYERTTQSGVLANAFMFGTPAIMLNKNLSEFAEDGKEVVAIDDNTSYTAIKQAVERVMADFSAYSSACRKRFLDVFYYRNYNHLMEAILK